MGLDMKITDLRNKLIKVNVMQRLREEVADPRTLSSSWLALHAVEIHARGANPRGECEKERQGASREGCDFSPGPVIPVTFTECPSLSRFSRTCTFACLFLV